MISREVEGGVEKKWKFIKLAMKFALLTSPALRRIISKFIKELNGEKIKLDEADWYYALDFHSYNFAGKEREWRHNKRKTIDKEKHHVFLI